MATNTWTALAPAPAGVGWGGSLTYANGYVYGFRGNGTRTFWRYSIATNTWVAMAPTPGNVSDGGCLTTDGTTIYGFQGKSRAYWSYSIRPTRGALSRPSTSPATSAKGARWCTTRASRRSGASSR